jgi:hypothetical protein
MVISRDFWICIRRALLLIVDALERELGIEPRTSDLRKDKNHPIL